MTATNDFGVLFAEVVVHGFSRQRVLVRTSETKHNNYYRESRGTRTDVSLGRGARSVVARLFPCNVIRQVVVEPPSGGAHPLYPNVDLAPSPFDALTVPVIDRRGKIQGVAIAEVQSRPLHVCFGRAHSLFPNPTVAEPSTKEGAA